MQLKRATGFGQERLCRLLWHTAHIMLSPNIIRHILRRYGLVRPHKKRRVFYPSHWVWQTKTPFTLAQVDVKEIYDKAPLGPRLVHHHLQQVHLPRYQRTLLEGRTYLRFLTFSHRNNLTNALCFAGLVLC